MSIYVATLSCFMWLACAIEKLRFVSSMHCNHRPFTASNIRNSKECFCKIEPGIEKLPLFLQFQTIWRLARLYTLGYCVNEWKVCFVPITHILRAVTRHFEQNRVSLKLFFESKTYILVFEVYWFCRGEAHFWKVRLGAGFAPYWDTFRRWDIFRLCLQNCIFWNMINVHDSKEEFVFR